MDAFFESPKHNNSNQATCVNVDSVNTAAADATNQASNDLQHQQQQEITSETAVTNTEQVNRRIDLDQTDSEQIQFETLQVVDQQHQDHMSDQHQQQQQQQLTQLTSADIPSSHVKLEMENGQLVVVDSSHLDSVVLVAATNAAGDSVVGDSGSAGEIIIQQNSDGTTTMLLDTGAAHQQHEQNSLLVTSSALGLVDHNEDSNQMDDIDDPNDTSMKEIDDTLAMSPGFASSLSGLGSQANYILNGNNVSTHTFRKTEWDVKKLENYVRLSFGDATPMEGMQPVKMNFYLVSFFKLAKKSDGMDYEPESLIGFMNSFERYLKTKNYPESLLRSETFKESRTELKKKRDLVRSIGKLIRTKTKDTCYLLQFHRNLLKEKGLLNRDNPDCLLAEIYLNNMIYFGEFLKEDKAWRGNLNLVWGDMILERDTQNNLEYLTLATYAKKSTRTPQQQQLPIQQQASPLPKNNSRTKTGTQTSKLRAAVAAAAAAAAANPAVNIHQTDANSPRVYARQPPSYCPIEAYKMYKSRRPNNCLDRDSPFYLAPLFKSKNQSKVWYKALAMSCQRLDALFYCLFKKAGVDLASLASMSQQQQQQAVAAAASIINNTNGSNENQLAGVVTPGTDQVNSVAGSQTAGSFTQWKSVMKEHNNQLPDEMNELIMNGSIKHVNNSNDLHNHSQNYHHQQQQQHSTANTNHSQQSTTYYTNSANNNSSNINATAANQHHHQQHHIVTTVPAQVQVQVQIQVQIPQHQQQNNSANNTALIV